MVQLCDHPNFETDSMVEKHYRDDHEAIIKEICDGIRKREPHLSDEEVQQKGVIQVLEIREQSCITVKRRQAAKKKAMYTRLGKSQPKLLLGEKQGIKKMVFFKKMRKAHQQKDWFEFCLHKTTIARCEHSRITAEIKKQLVK